jgi:hypothetical protein
MRRNVIFKEVVLFSHSQSSADVPDVFDDEQ